MVQVEFAYRVKSILESDEAVWGLAVGGSWLNHQMDEFSDLDLIIVTKEKITHDTSKMFYYAEKMGNFLSGFTGEHVGEPRLLICLFDNPLLHVDIKFITLDEFKTRIETPFILLDKNNQLHRVLEQSEAHFPYPDFQWIENRFWIWIHYALLKIGRGEYLEAFDFLGFLRMVVIGPLLHIKNQNLPRGVRKAEFDIEKSDFESLKSTIPNYQRQSLLDSLKGTYMLYQQLRTVVFDEKIQLQKPTEKRVLDYFIEIETRNA